ncbi:MAG: hypothetical protein A4S09_03375 [Proteobacteria bacterium SG_bin7]|nr:MAG: hypothetical protein A4S09_03375 [Proteobacteria bacterium SG_bin7]
MTNEQVSNFRAMLEDRLVTVEKQIDKFRREISQVPEIKPAFLKGGMDHVMIEGDINTRIDIHELTMDLKRNLYLALKKIDDGTYGLCECCGDKIDIRRLQVQPTALLCLTCQKVTEATAPIIQQPVAWVRPTNLWKYSLGVA